MFFTLVDFFHIYSVKETFGRPVTCQDFVTFAAIFLILVNIFLWKLDYNINESPRLITQGILPLTNCAAKRETKPCVPCSKLHHHTKHYPITCFSTPFVLLLVQFLSSNFMFHHIHETIS